MYSGVEAMKAVFSRLAKGLVYGAEFLAVVFIILLCAFLLLMFRLSQSPMRADFLVAPIQRVLNEHPAGYDISFDEAWLAWGGYFEPFRIDLKNISIRGAQGVGALKVDNVGVGLSKTGLSQFRIQPKEIIVQGLSFRLMRDQDGRFGLDMGDEIFTLESYGPPLPQGMQKERRRKLVLTILSQLKGGEGDLARLRRFIVKGATVGYEDAHLGLRWVGRNSDFVLSRAENGVNITADMMVHGNAGRRTSFRANGFYDWSSQNLRSVVAFNGLNLSEVAKGSDLMKPLAGIDLPWRGSIALEIDRDFRLQQTRFILAGGAGLFNLDLGGKYFYDESLPVQSVYAEGETKRDSADQRNVTRFIFKNISANLGKVRAQATANGVLNPDKTVDFAMNAALLDMPMDELSKYWPQPLTPVPRDWVTGHLSGGTARKASIDLDMSYRPLSEKKSVLNKLAGEISFDGIAVDYFAPLAPVKNVSGKASYDADSFHLEISGGQLEDMKVGKTKIDITDLDKVTEDHHPTIKIATSVSGPLLTALKVLDSKPLEYPKSMGIRLAEKGKVSGRADIDVVLSFPLHQKLSVSEVKVGADAKLYDVTFKNVARGLDMSGGPLDLKVSNSRLNVTGSGIVGGQPARFDWKKNFSSGAREQMSLDIEMPVTAQMMKDFGAPQDIGLTGSVAAKIGYVQFNDSSARVDVSADITPLAIVVDALDFEKKPGEAGSLAASLNMAGDAVKSIEKMQIKIGDQMVSGAMEFLSGHVWKTIDFPRVLLGGSDFSLRGTNNGKSGYDVTLKGARIDMARFFKDQRPPSQRPDAGAAPTVPLQVSFNVARMTTGENFALTDVRGKLQRNGQRRIERLDLDATAGGKPVTLRFGPQGKGYALKFEAQNAGQALAVLGVTKSVRGGHLIINGIPLAGGGPRDLTGTAVLGKFSLKDTPVIAKLLNALSVPGLLSLLSGDGINFEKARAKFTWIDSDGAQTQRLLGIKGGQTSGSSLGLTFEGTIDKWDDIYNLDGTIVPVSDFSKLISKVPLIGDILTAGGEGFIAATYKVKGPMDKPEVSVNPLSVLAPGVLRKIFFEK
jgi:hypothetical protein